MKKLAKIIFGIIGVFVLLIIAAAVILPMVVSPNDYKPQIVEAVKDKTGRDLVIDGDIGLSVFPKLGLTLGKTSLSNAAGFKGKTFASVDAVNIHVALMPLLDEEIEMDEVVLEGLNLNLQKNKSGVSNWDDIAAASSESESKDDKDDDDRREIEIEGLAIGGIRITDATIQWQDDSKGQQYTVQGFNLTSGALKEGEPVELKLETDFSSAQPAMKGRATMTTTVLADPEEGRFSFDAFKTNLNLTGEGLPGGKSELSLASKNIAVDLEKQTLTVKALSLATLGIQLDGQVSGTKVLSDKPQIAGQIKLQEFNARTLMASLDIPAPVTADPDVLTRVSAGFDLTATPDTASLKSLQVKLDDTSLKGSASVRNFSQPAIGFDLNVDTIDLDRYLPPPAEKPVAESGQPANPDAELFPVDALRKLNAKGVARIAHVKINKLSAADVVAILDAKSGKVNLKPTAKLYQGTYNSNVTIDARLKVPKLNVDARLSGVQIEPLLKDMQGEAKLAGQTDATVNITATGNSQAAIKKTLSGNTAFSFKDGALVGINIAKIIREGMAEIEGKSLPKTTEPEKTDFSALKGTATITNGVVDNRDFILKSPLLRVNGAGKVDLVQEKLDYLLKTAIVGSLQGQGGDELAKLKGVTIPVRVKGPFSDPSIRPDISTALTEGAKKKIDEAVEKKKEEAKKKVEDKFKDKLKDKFKGLF